MKPAVRFAAGAALATAATAGIVTLRAKSTERAHPAIGRFVFTDGVRLHYVERGSGNPIVLLHGNGVSSDDFVTSGILDVLARDHRVIAFDRPGFGYSERPRNRPWTPLDQARLLHAALEQLGVAKPTVVAHSWGTLVALAMTMAFPLRLRGLVLESGYYYPTPRLDAAVVGAPAIPVVGDVLRYTLSPVAGRLLAPLLLYQLFAPAPVAPSFRAYPLGMSLRPWALRAAAAEGAMMIGAASRLQSRYEAIRLPVDVIAGTGDLIANPTIHSVRLAGAVDGAALHLVEGAGHMVHHTAPERVLNAISANEARSALAFA